MKKSLFTLLAVLLPFTTFAQLKVDSLGNVGIHTTDSLIAPFVFQGTENIDEGLSLIARPKEVRINLKTINAGSTPSQSRALYIYNTEYASKKYGLWSQASGSTKDSNGRIIGVLGFTNASYLDTGIGVLGSYQGSSNGAGIMGCLQGASGVAITGKYAGYFNGNVKVTGTIDGTLTNPSDMRLKENVETLADDVRGGVLGTLSLLTPISYNYKDDLALYAQREVAEEELPEEEDIFSEDALRDNSIKENPNPILLKRHYGFSAQELQEIYPELVYENDNGYLSVNYVELIPILVQAINELQDEITELRDGRAAMSKERMPGDADETVISDVEAVVSDVAFMGQNVPNPFTEKTDIPVFVPQDIKTATLYIYDLSGKQLEQHEISGRGETTMTIHADKMEAGMYVYSLITDGKVVTTRKMIVTK